MDAIAGKVLDGLSSLALEEFNLLRDLSRDKEKMERTVSAIKAAVLDAEATEKTRQVDDWLDKLKDVLYDADDLLDDFSAESLAGIVMNRNKSAKKVRTFCSRSNQVAYAHVMSRRMKDIRKKFDGIADDKNKLKLDPSSSKPPIAINEWREIGSFVREEEVIGREEEKNRLKGFLLNPHVGKDVSVITINGFGGLGKTTLAQLVYNDEDVQRHFELKMWICVSDQFSVKEIGQKMLQCENNANIEQVQEKLRGKISGRKFLLLLDDVWNDDRNLWLNLKRLLLEGERGSMVIVTTRIARVKEIMDADLSLDLKGLDDEGSWKLFSQMAFEDKKGLDFPKLIEIGKEIVKKCVGIPLALKVIGGLLYKDLSESNWTYFKENDLLVVDENDDILSILKLSYDHLSSNLKNCFTYCSLFPKDYKIDRKTLIQLWMAQGFIPLLNKGRRPEDIGHDYFMNLLSRSFFQDVKRDGFGDIETCKMHDLMHDLATSMSKNECKIVNEENKKSIGDRMRHLSFDVTLDGSWKPPVCLLEAGKLRTILLPGLKVEYLTGIFSLQSLVHFLSYRSWVRFYEHSKLKRSVIGSLISRLKVMRVLDLHGLKIQIIPKNIQNLKHLRYLDLSDNDVIQKIPKGITRLHHLQTLKLNWCVSLTELPRDINKLVSLRHLELHGCWSLSHMPHGLGQLTSLQTMSRFDLGPIKSDSARLSELSDLNNLRGSLLIAGLEHMRSDVEAVMPPKLLEKPHLQDLGFWWSNRNEDDMGRKGEVAKDQVILQYLKPLPTIKALHIGGFRGSKLPDWIGCLSSLQRLDISYCKALTSLPEGIGNLSSLQDLCINACEVLTSLPESIRNLSSLQTLRIEDCAIEDFNGAPLPWLPQSRRQHSLVQELSINHCNGLTSLPVSICSLSSLQTLTIKGCALLPSLPESIGQLSLLQELSIVRCNGLTSLPESIWNLSSLRTLTIRGCALLPSLPQSRGQHSLLQELIINHCNGLTSLPESICSLSSLQTLTIEDCALLPSLPESIGQLSLLQKLSIYCCNGLTSLPESIWNLSSLQTLRIGDCALLPSLPESRGQHSSLQELSIYHCNGLTSLPESIGQLSLLDVLRIDHCNGLTSLPESIGQLSSLEVLDIVRCNGLTSLPESIGQLSSLQGLSITCCNGLASLPEGIQNLRSLQSLSIYCCRQLKKRYKRKKGGDWPKLAHIPHVAGL